MQKTGTNYHCVLKQKLKHEGWCTVCPRCYRYKYSKHFSLKSPVCLSRHWTTCDIRSEVKRRKTSMKKENQILIFAIHHCVHMLYMLFFRSTGDAANYKKENW